MLLQFLAATSSPIKTQIAGARQELLENHTAAAVSLPGAPHRGGWGHRGEVGVDLYTRQVVPKPTDPGSGDELTVVQLYSLEVVASHEMVEALVCDEGTVIQLKDCQVLAGTRGHAKVTDSLIRYQFTVGQGKRFQTWTRSG